MIGFADPWALLLLPLPLVLALAGLLPSFRDAAMFVPGGVAERLSGASAPGGLDRAVPMLRRLAPAAIWLCLVAALAGPRMLAANPALPVSGRDLVLVFDLSGSMVREDFELNGAPMSRLDALKLAATRFVRGRGGDRVALVIFGAQAYFATPQTFDTEAVAGAIQNATIGISGRATAISEGLGLALKRLRNSEAASKVIVLLSDGVNNSGPARPRDVAVLAREHGVRVHTIAMGHTTLAEQPRARDAVDAETLRGIAELSGGTFFRVRTTDDLLSVTEAIDRLETDETAGPSALLWHPLWTWPAIAALMIAGALGWSEARR